MLIYFEDCRNTLDAQRREYYLKTKQGQGFLGLQLLEAMRQKKALGSGN